MTDLGIGSNARRVHVRSLEHDDNDRFPVAVDGFLERWPLEWITNAIAGGAKVTGPED